MSTVVTASNRLLSESRQKLRNAARCLPERPGVYMMHDSKDKIIYIGKAVNLRRRVMSYATPSAAKDRKVSELVSRFASLSFVETASELEALLIESRLIKSAQPMFNRKLIVPESHCYITMDLREAIPCIRTAFSLDVGTLFMGPFWNPSLAREAVEAVADAFRLRRCSGIARPGARKWGCTLHELGKCSAPCSGRVSDMEYKKLLSTAWDSLAGKSNEAVRSLVARRNRLSDELRFEAAYGVQRQITALEYVASSSSESLLPWEDIAVVAPSHYPGRPVVLIFKEGRLIDRLIASPKKYPDEEILLTRLARLHISTDDLLPGNPSSDDQLIIRSYTRRRGNLMPIPSEMPACEAAYHLHNCIEPLRSC